MIRFARAIVSSGLVLIAGATCGLADPPRSPDRDWPSAWNATVTSQGDAAGAVTRTPDTPAVLPPASPSPTPAAAIAQAPADDPSPPAGPTPPSDAVSPAAPPAPSPPQAAPSAAAEQPAQPVPAPAPQPPAPARPAPPPPAALEELLAPTRQLAAVIEDLEKTVERLKDNEAQLGRLRGEIDRLPAQADRVIEALRPRLADAEAQLGKLGPAPKEGEAAEAPEIASERERLGTLVTQIDGGIKSAELSLERSRQLLARTQELRHQLFTQRLFERSTRSPLRPSVWTEVGRAVPEAAAQIRTIASSWWMRASLHSWTLAGIAAAAVLLYLALRAARRRLLAMRYAPHGTKPPGFFVRAATAGLVAVMLALPAIIAALVAYLGLDSLDLLYLQSRDLGESLLLAVLTFVAVSSLSRALLQPGRPTWRLVDLSDRAAARLNLIVRAMAATYAVDMVLKQLIRSLYMPVEVSVSAAFVTTLVFAGLLLAIVRTPFEPASTTPGLAVSRWQPYTLKLPLLGVGLAMVATTLAGYIALGRFIAGQVVLTGSVIVVVILLHLAIRALTGTRDRVGEVGTLIEQRLGLDETQRRQMSRTLTLVLNAVLAIVAIPLVLLTLGFSGPDILATLKSALFGFEIGQFRISLVQIVIALGLFVGLMLLTRLVQRWLTSNILVPPRVETGLAHSIHTAVGYVGFAIAALAAVSFGGLDITNLAIVAGALSVGIGFGLQSIVNNFVSGLILLVERPVKVGDWIRVGASEGHVRRISVRATEIETFDRASVIIPNSELITGTVTNLTHRNALGRLVIRVGVSYSSDPEQVVAALQKVAEESTSILRHPAPLVAFENFGDSALEFSLRVFLADINRSLGVQTELRIAIAKAFRREGIEVPFPQVDVHLRDLDRLKSAIASVMAERARQAAERAATSARNDTRAMDEPSAAGPAKEQT